jgi:hypothetical protein
VSRQLELRDLLVSLFTPEELRRFLLHGPDGEAILRSLPESTSFAELAEASVEALERRGLVDERFFERMTQARPRRVKDIESAWRSWLRGERRVEQPKAEWDFFIAYARPDRLLARALSDELKSLGCRVFLDRDEIAPGDDWIQAVHEAQRHSRVTVVLLSSSTGAAFAQREEIATGFSLVRDASLGHRVVPVFLEKVLQVEGLYGLMSLSGLSVQEDGGLKGIALRLRRMLETAVSHEASLQTGDQELTKLARRFFRAAGREVGEGNSRNGLTVLLPGPMESVSEPETVEVCGEPRPSRVDVRKLASRLRPGLIGYFVHRGELPLDTEEALNTLRVQGQSIVPLSERLMSTALQDANASAVLHSMSQQGRGGDDLFRTRNALVDRRFLFGRSELLARIGSALGRGEQILLTGNRKIGKTSFLNILRQDLEQPAAVIDLQRYDRTRPNWVEKLFHEIVAAYDRWGGNRFKDWPAEPGNENPADALELEGMLGERRRWHAERGPLSRLVVILDELERLLPQPGEADIARSFIRGMGALRALAQGGDRFVSIIAADLRPTANRRNRLTNGTNPFFEFFQEMPLPLLARKSVDEMIGTIGRMMGVGFVEMHFLEELFDLSGGHPFVARTLASAAYKQRRRQDRLLLDDLHEGLAELEDDDVLGNFFDENFWLPLDGEERRILAAVASGESPNGSPKARASLKRQGLVDRSRIPIAAFADWILRYQADSAMKAATG